nr:hypothetical protein Iba_chr14bCG7480 [Ipomoea batatas]
MAEEIIQEAATKLIEGMGAKVLVQSNKMGSQTGIKSIEAVGQDRIGASVSASLVEVDSGYLVWFERFGETTKPENNVGVALGRSELEFGLGA